jgi:RHS repeat-associated protein
LDVDCHQHDGNGAVMIAKSAMRARSTMKRKWLQCICLVAAWCLVCSTGVFAQSQDTVIYYHTDAIGSVRMITNATGQVLARYDFLPFGELWSPSPPVDARQFAGKERDAETGFDYFGARYYRSAQGRFTSPDAADADLTNPQTFNRYRYALNNPLHYIDRDGFYEEDVHRDLTAVLALAAGFSLDRANAIGAATQWVDDDPRTDPTAPRNVFNEQMRAEYHFTSEARRAAMWTRFERSASMTALGEYMHAFQDSYSHQGFGSRYGHARVGKAPDKTTTNPAKADRMAEATYGRLVAAGVLIPVSSQAIAYKRIEQLVAKFNRANDKDKPAVIAEIRREIEKERDQ